MTWDEVLLYDKEIKYMAQKWSTQAGEPSLCDDAIQHARITLFEKLDLAKARGPHRNFVLGAVNNILYKFFRSNKYGKWRHYSLDKLYEEGVQIDEELCVRRPVGKQTGHTNGCGVDND